VRQGWRANVPMGTLCSIDSGSSNTQDAVDDAQYALFDRSKKIKRSTRYLFDCEALIIPGEGTEFLPRHYIGKFDLHQRAYALHNFSKEIDVKYLYYYLIYMKDYFPHVAVGATVKSLRRRHFEDLPVTVGPLHEQRRIVSILGDFFEGLETANNNFQKNLENTRQVFESHLNALFARASENYDVATLADICERVTVGHVGITAPHYRSSGVLFLRTQNITRTGLLLEDLKYVTREFHESQSKSHVIAGDILIARHVTDRMNCALVPSDFLEANCSNIILVRPGPSLSGQYLKYYISSPVSQARLLQHRVGSAQQVVNTGILKGWKVPLPPRSAQQKIVNLLDDLSESTTRLESSYARQLEAISELRNSLLQKAFSGELTCPPPQAIKEAAA
jgi:type I restriction enzyme S subunit